jgi:predicted secreted protein
MLTDSEFDRFLCLPYTVETLDHYSLMFMGKFVLHSDIKDGQDCAMKKFEKIATKPGWQLAEAMQVFQNAARVIRSIRPSACPPIFTTEAEWAVNTYNTGSSHAARKEQVENIKEGNREVVEAIKENTAAIDNNTRNQERAVFNGTFRSQARFAHPIDEVAIEKIHRLRCDNVEWNYIGRTIYSEETGGKNINETELPYYVNALQQRYRTAYPDPTKKKTKK